jgi:hypothetical protein
MHASIAYVTGRNTLKRHLPIAAECLGTWIRPARGRAGSPFIDGISPMTTHPTFHTIFGSGQC